jgi:hypothetical protein
MLLMSLFMEHGENGPTELEGDHARLPPFADRNM